MINEINSLEILGEITTHMKYAKYVPELQRRETYSEICDRNMDMHIKKYPQLEEEIRGIYTNFVKTKKVLPSMRSMQFAGTPIERNPTRIYNCAYLPIDHPFAFSEALFLLLGGTGVGYSVQSHHIEKLPEIRKPNLKKSKRFLIGDSIEGWADSIKILMKSYFNGGSSVNFDYGDIRPKGARLITAGGKAPGPDPLKECHLKIVHILNQKEDGDQLTSIEVHDIMCHLADAVLAGGIRRAAMISLFDADDMDMISCKSGNWWELNPQRGRANNSAVLLRNKITQDYFMDLWKRIENSRAGEPGIFLTNDKDLGTNPCCFTGDTLITVKDITTEEIEGVEYQIPIKELVKLKDSNLILPMAMSLNIETQTKEWKQITDAFLSKKDATIIKLNLEINGVPTSIKCTPDHKFYTSNRGYVEAKDLTNSDELVINN
jgi:ribonucleoside-diphosphate reductase alpha chain